MIRQCTSIIEYYIRFKSLWTCNYKAINNIIPHLASNNNKFLFLHSSSFGSMRSMATACSSAPYISIQKSAFGAKTVLKQTQLVSFKKAATIKLRSSFKTKVNTNYLIFSSYWSLISINIFCFHVSYHYGKESLLCNITQLVQLQFQSFQVIKGSKGLVNLWCLTFLVGLSRLLRITLKV